MSLFTYSLQAGVALALMYLFYRVFLVRLTFYHANRFYLLGYTVLALAIPFYNTGRVLPERAAQITVAYNRIATAVAPTRAVMTPSHAPVVIDWVSCILLGGMAVMLIRLLVQLFSLVRLWTEATHVGQDGRVRIYRLPYPLAPFSFGPNIFISPETQASPDLPRIVEHEKIHIRQAHTLDILLGQLLLVLQWWNPGVWLLNRSIRLNLEFLADQGVLDQGADRKQYQYLLLSVSGMGVPALSNPLNFSPLKNRITMMNKKRSARHAGARFLFALPLGVLLLAAAARHPRPGDGVLHFQGFVVDSHTYKPIGGVVLKEVNSGITGATDNGGYFRLNFPRGADTLRLKFNVTGSSIDAKEVELQFNPPGDGSVEDKAYFLIGAAASSGGRGYSFVNEVPGDADDLMGKDTSIRRLMEDKAIADIKHIYHLQTIFDSHPYIYYEVDGKSYVISAAGGYAAWDGMLDEVMVNGKTLMTGEELNVRYNKHQVMSYEALDAKKAQRRFGIARNMFAITIDTTASL